MEKEVAVQVSEKDSKECHTHNSDDREELVVSGEWKRMCIEQMYESKNYEIVGWRHQIMNEVQCA